MEGEAGTPVTVDRRRAGGRPEAARRAGLESVVEKRLTATSPARVLARPMLDTWTQWQARLAVMEQEVIARSASPATVDSLVGELR
jgi:hypothetical protein